MKRQSVSCFSERSLQSELIKSYKRWLTAPQEKENAMGQFKDYVNTLATIKQENGEKYFLLKKKFYTEYFTNIYPPPAPFDSFNSDNSAHTENNNGYYLARKPSSSGYQDLQSLALCPSRTQLQVSAGLNILPF